MALAAEIAGRSPDAVRGAKALFNRLANAGAAEQFAEERRVIGCLIGTPNQVEAVMANFEKRPPAFTPTRLTASGSEQSAHIGHGPDSSCRVGPVARLTSSDDLVTRLRRA